MERTKWCWRELILVSSPNLVHIAWFHTKSLSYMLVNIQLLLLNSICFKQCSIFIGSVKFHHKMKILVEQTADHQRILFYKSIGCIVTQIRMNAFAVNQWSIDHSRLRQTVNFRLSCHHTFQCTPSIAYRCGRDQFHLLEFLIFVVSKKKKEKK